MRIQHNLSAMNAQRNLVKNNGNLGKNLEKLASGYGINRAADNAAGLGISEKMRAHVTGLQRAEKNAHDGVSLIQTTEGALTEVHTMMNRMIELATESANGIYDDHIDRKSLDDEINALKNEVDRIAHGTHFNRKNVLNGDYSTQAIADFKGEAIGKNAGVDLMFEMEKDFAPKGVSFSFSKGNPDSTTIINKAPNDVSTVEIIVNPDKDYSAREIEELVHKGAKQFIENNPTDEKSKELGELLKDMHIVGKGVTKAPENPATGFNPNTAVKANIKVPGVTTSLNIQIGTGTNDNDKLSLINLDARHLGIDTIGVSSEVEAGKAIERINNAIEIISSQRGALGAIQNRLEHSINSLNCDAENMIAAESRIRDCDMAREMMSYTKNNILVQASQSMLAQAGHLPEGIMQLLQ